MLTATAPTTGANFQRLDLKTVVDGLKVLHADLELNHQLSDDQLYWFHRYLSAWDFYRPSQPESYQLEVETAIADIFGNQVFG